MTLVVTTWDLSGQWPPLANWLNKTVKEGPLKERNMCPDHLKSFWYLMQREGTSSQTCRMNIKQEDNVSNWTAEGKGGGRLSRAIASPRFWREKSVGGKSGHQGLWFRKADHWHQEALGMPETTYFVDSSFFYTCIKKIHDLNPYLKSPRAAIKWTITVVVMTKKLHILK